MIEVRDLTCGYGSDPVLRHIDVRIGAGEFVAVIGPNGSGKTTLLRALSRVIRPPKGSVFLGGRDIGDMGYVEFARKVAVVGSMGDRVLPMPVEEYVLLGRTPHRRGLGLRESREDLRQARNAMSLTGVAGLRGRRVDSLSSGEKQMVSIARALAQEPILLLLDEPTSHLDITHQVRVLELVRALNRDEGLTVIAILHDLSLAGQYCDRLLLVKDGAIVKDGVPGEVLTEEIIEAVYETPVAVFENPVSAKPYVCPLPIRHGSRMGRKGEHTPEDGQ